MLFQRTKLNGVVLIEPERIEDDRGVFARTFCAREFAKHGINMTFAQCNTVFNTRKGTVRGLHYQCAPHEEEMLVRCTRGSAYVVVVDVRESEPTWRTWEAFELSAANQNLLYIPKGVADGFQTLEDKTEVFFQMSQPYAPSAQRGIRYNDPLVGITWPLDDVILSQRDKGFLDAGK
ncbi:MAG: dTDP-4-dehydrorhamnose 3,5-epimerase [Lentisphaerae bacterium]|nr:dTDP-4-dehydrorhamnose 3,5-epimerase [Lentisphaerota bacterium]